MDKKTQEMLSELTPTQHLGPAMLALNERQRKFVTAIVVLGGNQAEAYMYAGYAATSDASAQASASRLANSEAIQAAIDEERPRRMKVGGAIALEVLFKMVTGEINTDGKTKLAAVNSYLDRAGINTKTVQEHLVKHEMSMEEVFAVLSKNAPTLGLTVNQLLGAPEPVDAEFEDVPAPSTEGLEDIF